MRLSELVADWGGFERFVAELNKTSDLVSVEHNVILVDRLGVKRQIDVLVTHRQGLYTYRTLVECKQWNHKVKRTHVDAMAKSMEDLGAARGVFFTTKGFQSGAVATARQSNIDLFSVRELSDAEWGKPGRILRFRLRVFDRALDPTIRFGLLAPLPVNIPEIHLHLNPSESQSRLWHDDDNSPADPLEKSIDDATSTHMQAIASALPDFPGEKIERIFDKWINLKFQRPPLWVDPKDESRRIVLGDILFRVLVRVRQSEFSVDRSKNFPIAHAIEDCITGATYLASRKNTEDYVKFSDIPAERQKMELPQDTIININACLVAWFEYPTHMVGGQPATPSGKADGGEAPPAS